MNVDFYAECLVEKRTSGSDTAKKVLIGVGIAVVSALLLTFLGFFGVLLVCLVFYGGFYLLNGIGTEYEYIITNGEMDIDKIMGKRTRKRLITADISSFTSVGPLSSAPDEADGTTTVLATDGSASGAYYADFIHKSAGSVRIVFTPNEKILDGIELFLPRQLKAEFKKNRPAKKNESYVDLEKE